MYMPHIYIHVLCVCVATYVYIYIYTLHVGHNNVREAMKGLSAKDTSIEFRKKRAPSTMENRTPLSEKAIKFSPQSLSDCTTTKTSGHTCSSVAPTSNSSGGTCSNRGLKRKATGSVVPPRKILQLHNYFNKVD